MKRNKKLVTCRDCMQQFTTNEIKQTHCYDCRNGLSLKFESTSVFKDITAVRLVLQAKGLSKCTT